MIRKSVMSRLAVLALGAFVALAALATTSAQQEPPHRFYGTDATAGDSIGVHANDDGLTLLGSATADDSGAWFVDVDRDAAEDVVFSVNGEVASADTASTGAGQTAVSNLVVAMSEPDDSGDGDGDAGDSAACPDEEEDLLGGDSDASTDCPDETDDSGDADSGDEGDDNGFPSTGSGGLADGGVSAGLIGLMIALGAVALAGLGVRRARNRA